MICASCGARFEGNGSICPNCQNGQRIKYAANFQKVGYGYGRQQAFEENYNVPPKKNNRGKIGLIIGLAAAIVVIVILAIVLLLNQGNSQGRNAVENKGTEQVQAENDAGAWAPAPESVPDLKFYFTDYKGGENSEYVISYVDNGNQYYCWGDGTVSNQKEYDRNSSTRWEIDKDGVVTVTAAYGVIAIYDPNRKTEPKVGDRDGSHSITALVKNAITNEVYVCWDNSEGAVTYDGKYDSGSWMIWTHPDNKRGYIIYSNKVGQDNVIYSEGTCDWCGNHKVYWYTYLTEYSWGTEKQYLFCENCHDKMMVDHHQCASESGHYYPDDMMFYYMGEWYCPKHW